jgi:Copper amine oxidase N-terminal domain
MKSLSKILLALAVAAVPAAASAQSVTVIVNGQTMNFTQPPIVRTGRVFVPLRGVFEQLGASVVYSNGQINATGNGRSISLTIGSTQATVGGQPETLDVAPFIVASTTFVPLRFISQALGATVNWNDSTSTVTIAGGGGAQPPPPGPRPIRFVTVAPTGVVYNPSPRIRFQFDRPVRLTDFRVAVDGRNVTSGLIQSGPAFVFDLPWRLSAGTHRVRVVGTTASGASFDLAWSFVRG